MIGAPLRLLRWGLLRFTAEFWRNRSRREMARARRHHGRFLLFRGRAEARDARADALYPPPATGPPGPDAAAVAEASAHEGWPQSRDTGRAVRLPPPPRGMDVAGG